ncbi:MAG: peptidase M2 family protein, partial [Acidobacteria bacterium]
MEDLMTRALAILILALLVVTSACGSPENRAPGEAAADAAGATRFVQEAEQTLEHLWIASERAAWVQANFITHDTELLAAAAYGKVLAETADLAARAARFNGLDLPSDVARKLQLLRTSLPLAAPRDPARQEELSRLAAAMESIYGKGRYCPPGEEMECLDLAKLSRVMAESRDPAELLAAWEGWRTISPPLAPMYARFVELANEGARGLGFADLGAMWRSGYDMPPADFAAEMERLWQQVRPLYEALHCHVRARLSEFYGPDVVAADGLIPAHLVGNMWSQSWSNIHDLVAPPDTAATYDLTSILEERKTGPREMVRFGERFFTSLGFEPLPDTFWERSLFTNPADRDVVCHPSAWN